MDAQVRHGSHGCLRLVEEPCPVLHDAPVFRPLMSEGRAEGENFSDRSLTDQRPGPLVLLHHALILPDHEHLPAFLGSLDHGFAFPDGHRHRFLAQDMLAGFQGPDRNLRVLGIRHADADRVNRRIGQELIHRLVNPAAVLCGHLFRPVPVPVAVTGNLGIRIRSIFGNMPVLRDAAASDDSCLYHTDLLLSLPCRQNQYTPETENCHSSFKQIVSKSYYARHI